MSSRAEDEYGRKWDRYLSNCIIKMGMYSGTKVTLLPLHHLLPWTRFDTDLVVQVPVP